MSRIHEALSKAARERTRHGSAGLAPTLVDITDGLKRSPVVDEGFEPVNQTTAEEQTVSATSVRAIGEYTQPQWKIDPRVNVFLPGTQERLAAERFRTLRSRLHQIAISEVQKLRIVLVTSATSAEGKSFVCANLAQSLIHRQDRKVLLIDADMRLPSQHKNFGAPRTPGLSNYLRGEAHEGEVLQKGPDSNLFLLPAGDEVINPSELLLSEQMKKLMKFSADTFDWVIVDSPPILPVHDASMLADLCDGVLLVVRAASTDFEIAAKAAEEFRRKNLLGVVFNCVEKGISPYTQYY
jgi:capsular exopolysaccharide synthesis family protein